jgi:hypothetical protein
MPHAVATRTKVLTIGLGALVAPVVAAGTANADPDHRAGGRPTPLPPASPTAVVSELLARGAAGEFDVRDADAGIRLRASEPTDLALVRATLAPHSSIPWHTHAGPSTVIVTSGTLRLVEPRHGNQHGRPGCTEEVFPAGAAFPHPSGEHAFANDGSQPVTFYVTYFLPEGASPAPVPVAPPPGC